MMKTFFEEIIGLKLEPIKTNMKGGVSQEYKLYLEDKLKGLPKHRYNMILDNLKLYCEQKKYVNEHELTAERLRISKLPLSVAGYEMATIIRGMMDSIQTSSELESEMLVQVLCFYYHIFELENGWVVDSAHIIQMNLNWNGSYYPKFEMPDFQTDEVMRFNTIDARYIRTFATVISNEKWIDEVMGKYFEKFRGDAI